LLGGLEAGMELLVREKLPCVLREDDHFLVVNKPAGISTHAPSPYAGQGIYEFLRGREARWADLATIHRLDKETSGLLVFSKTAAANRSLTQQFTARRVEKKYLFETDRPADFQEREAESALVRAGDRYMARPVHAGAATASTRFRFLRATHRQTFLWQAEPLTGRTHQIRIHAAFIGIPILGDSVYGGTGWPRVCLHAAELGFDSVEGKPLRFRLEPDFQADPREAMRNAIIDPAWTTAYRMIHGAADGWPGWYVDRLGDYLLSQSEAALNPAQETWLRSRSASLGARAAYHKTFARKTGSAAGNEGSPRLVFGEPAPEEFPILENGATYLARFSEGASFGLFLDQRENRRRWLAGDGILRDSPQNPKAESEAAGENRLESPATLPARASLPEILNAFAYTCGFSICAAKAGARVTSLDLSRKYLDWGRRNFIANGIDPASHDFVHGDVLDWLRRFERKGRTFDAMILDPPTFSRSKEGGVWRVEKDFPALLAAGLRILKSPGMIFASSNSARWRAEDFAAALKTAAASSGRALLSFEYAAQPLDFPVHPREPAHFKSVRLRIA
jgi:23S rRNA (cytosine1962-C5)-methyltransferase